MFLVYFYCKVILYYLNYPIDNDVRREPGTERDEGSQIGHFMPKLNKSRGYLQPVAATVRYGQCPQHLKSYRDTFYS